MQDDLASSERDEEKEEEIKRSLQEQRTLGRAILDDSTPDTPDEAIRVEADDEHGWGIAAGATRADTGGDGGDERRVSGIVNPGVGEFDAVVRGVKPGQLRSLFVSNLRRRRSGELPKICVQVRMATLSLAGSEEEPRRMIPMMIGPLEEGEVLRAGSFGVVTAARHGILGERLAVKRLKEVRERQRERGRSR